MRDGAQYDRTGRGAGTADEQTFTADDRAKNEKLDRFVEA
jgi:hypothetical protein